MKKLRVLALASAFTLALTSALTFPAAQAFAVESCSCSAGDGSCSASVSCRGGCISLCPSGGCVARCSGYFSTLGTEVTLQMQNGNTNQLLDELARVSGNEITFSPKKLRGSLNLDIKKAALWDIFDVLSANGTVKIEGQDFQQLKELRRVLLSGEKLSLCVQNTSVGTLVSDLASLSGLPIRITAGSPMASVNEKLQDVTLKEFLDKVAEQTGTKITDDAADFNDQ